MTVTFGTCSDDPRTLRKTMTDTADKQVQIFNNCSAKNPAFILDVQAANFHANYCRCAWGSFFISEPEVIDGNRCIVRGTLDYLDTYADKIADLSGYLVRTENEEYHNKYLHDNQVPVQERRLLYTKKFNANPFFADFVNDGTYVLCVMGGAH